MGLEPVVQFICRRGRDLLPKAVCHGPAACIGFRCKARLVQLADPSLNGNVAGQIPQSTIHKRAGERMPEHAVQQYMQIIPGDCMGLFLVALQQPSGILIQVFPDGFMSMKRMFNTIAVRT